MNRAILLFLLLFPTFVFSYEGFYARGLGGVNLLEDDLSNADVDYRPGFLFMGCGGYAFQSGLRLEIEGSFRRTSIEQIIFNSLSSSIHGHVYSLSAIANVIYEIPLNCVVRPYYGFGVGYGFECVNLLGPNLGNIDTTNSRLVCQWLGGLTLAITHCYSTQLQYQYLDFDDNVDAHAVTIGIVRKF